MWVSAVFERLWLVKKVSHSTLTQGGLKIKPKPQICKTTANDKVKLSCCASFTKPGFFGLFEALEMATEIPEGLPGFDALTSLMVRL